MEKKFQKASMVVASGLLVASMIAVCQCAEVVSTFKSNYDMNHLVKTKSGKLLVGAVNNLYVLDGDLQEEQTAITGPVNDSTTCGLFNTGCSGLLLTNNYNKILAIGPSDKLVTCGNVFQGTCQLRPLNNITQTTAFNTITQIVAANVPEKSTVGVVLPDKESICVGASYSPGIPARARVPVVSKRRLIEKSYTGSRPTDYPFNLYFKNQYGTKLSGVRLSSTSISSGFNIRFVSGFNKDAYTYFLTTQPVHRSRIVRVCHGDDTYYSYIDIPIECKSNTVDYNLVQAAYVTTVGSDVESSLGLVSGQEVLAAVFSKSRSPASDEPSEQSALCFYKFDDIIRKINENGDACFLREGMTNAGNYEATTRRCENLGSYSLTSCGQLEAQWPKNTPIIGTSPISSAPFMTMDDSSLTSLLFTSVEEHTVAYLGTNNGALKKVYLKSSSISNEFAEIDLDDDNNPVMQDMVFDDAKEHFYVMSSNKIHKIKTQDCLSYQTCGDCVAARDPHCGWCTLENKCSLISECRDPDPTKFKWFDFTKDPSTCTDFSRMNPDHLSRDADPITISLTISNLPLGDTFTCVFGDEELSPVTTTSAVKTSEGLQCRTPDKMLIPSNRTSDNVVVPLSVNSSETGIRFLTRHFTFFNCVYHSSCTKCAQSQWGCNWCIFDNKCVHSTNNSVCQPGIVTADTACPRLLPSTTDILLPNGFSKEIHLNAINLPTPMMGQTEYKCQVEADGNTFISDVRFPATDKVVCEKNPQVKYSYIGEDKQKKASISLVWNGNFVIDNPTNVQATMYKCGKMGQSQCGFCHSLLEVYKCEWQTGGGCKYKENPSDPKICPEIIIDTVTPLNTTIDGNRLVTITGKNLGSSAADVTDAVELAGKICKSENLPYETSKRIVCETAHYDEAVTGTIKVSIGGVETVWNKQFEFKNPQMTDFFPKLGPKSGGTRITIDGSDLETGPWEDFSISLDGTACDVETRTDNQTTCIVNGKNVNGVVTNLIMTFNNTQRTLPVKYVYTPDPTIESIKPLRTFIGGGRNITVIGTHFTSIQEPKMFVKRGDKESSRTACDVRNKTTMICPSPAVLEEFIAGSRRKRASEDITFAFIMDNVMKVQNLKKNFPNMTSTVSYVPNPVYDNFTEKDAIKILKEDKLIIEGSNLNLACTEEEVTVMIGNEICVVTSLAKSQLVCSTPEEQPQGLDKDGKLSSNDFPIVTVHVGNLHFTVGKVQYYVYVLATWVIIVIVVSIAILLAIIVVIVILFRRKSNKAVRDYRKMQIQLDTMESNVRNECKLAFAELQTDMSDLTSDLVATGIPFLEYDAYIFKVLFPGHTDHPSLHEFDDNEGAMIQGMEQFEQLILNKHFLLMFIRTLEQQKTFAIRDKANVASLLMVSLLDKMEYATEILRALLGELIERSVEKKLPKLMLRRTESVVEKLLTNWLSICMYTYIQESAGNALFIMFKSIKHQVEKGPVDALTGDARYSLSEDRLLREKLEPVPLTIEVVLDNEETIPGVKVLDCDSVTQVKEKMLDAIYKNTAYSQRPNPHDTELEWRHGRGGHLTLADDDVTTKVEDGWKKLNTLSHYKVSDEALMALVPKQHNGANIRNNGNIGPDTTITSINSNTPFMNEVENGAKCWHLVKSDDMVQKDRHKAISEIFLTRLLSTKGTLQKFIDDLFQTILCVNGDLPPAIKYLFDFLDESAKQHGIFDPEVVYTWKSNSLPLRFWVNIIKNPDFVFDIKKTHIVDSCLSVVAQTFMDSCSQSEHRLGKDSPTNKLLFAKDIQNYRKYVENYYSGIQDLPPLSEQEINSAMVDISRKAPTGFYRPAALKELYNYAIKYESEIIEALEEDRTSVSLQLAQKLKRVDMTLQGPLKI